MNNKTKINRYELIEFKVSFNIVRINIKNNKLNFERESEFYMFSNKDGYYYAINPRIENNGNYGFNIYPKTEIRKKLRKNNNYFIFKQQFVMISNYKSVFKNYISNY